MIFKEWETARIKVYEYADDYGEAIWDVYYRIDDMAPTTVRKIREGILNGYHHGCALNVPCLVYRGDDGFEKIRFSHCRHNDPSELLPLAPAGTPQFYGDLQDLIPYHPLLEESVIRDLQLFADENYKRLIDGIEYRRPVAMPKSESSGFAVAELFNSGQDERKIFEPN